MTIPRVKNLNWIKGEELSSYQISQLDKHIDGALSKYFHNDVYSDLTISNNGSLSFLNNAALTISNPENISIADGYLSLDIIINGSIKPLRFGYKTITLPEYGTFSITSADLANASIIILEGDIQGDLTITFDYNLGMVKYLVCNYTNTNTATITCQMTGLTDKVYLSKKDSNNNIIIDSKNKIVKIYSQSEGIYSTGAEKKYYRMIDTKNIKGESLDFTTTTGSYNPNLTYDAKLNTYIYTNDNAISIGDYSKNEIGFTDLTSKRSIVYLDGRYGDIFEIELNSDTYTPEYLDGYYIDSLFVESETVSSALIYPKVCYGKTWISDNNSFSSPSSNTKIEYLLEASIGGTGGDGYNSYEGKPKTIFIAPLNGCYEFSFASKYTLTLTSSISTSCYPINTLSPINYTVTQYRLY